jgi:hypothetical protein
VRAAMKFFQNKILNIEISKDDKKETIFFPKLPICDNTPPRLVDNFVL